MLSFLVDKEKVVDMGPDPTHIHLDSDFSIKSEISYPPEWIQGMIGCDRFIENRKTPLVTLY